MRLDVSPSSTPEPWNSSSARVSFSSLFVKEFVCAESHGATRNCTNSQLPQTATFSRDACDPSTRETAYRAGRGDIVSFHSFTTARLHFQLSTGSRARTHRTRSRLRLVSSAGVCGGVCSIELLWSFPINSKPQPRRPGSTSEFRHGGRSARHNHDPVVQGNTQGKRQECVVHPDGCERPGRGQ